MSSRSSDRRRFLALAGAGVLAGCGPRGSLTFAEPPPDGAGSVKTLLVASTRQIVDGQPVFSRDRVDPPIFAEFKVWIPPERAVGSVVFPQEQPPNFDTDFVTVAGRRIAGVDAYVAAINADLARNPQYEGRASIFIHGYNTNFAEGLYRHAQILTDYGSQANSTHFAWPSAASTKGYVYDRESALFSRDGLELTLQAMARSNAREITLIAHSMGCHLLMETLRVMARGGGERLFAKTNAIVLLSPDIEVDVFRMQAPPVIAQGTPIFVVVSTRDRALRMSSLIRAERTPRLGSISSPAELDGLDVTVIDLSNVEAGGGMGHFAVARSPYLINLLSGLRQQGMGILETGQDRGLIGSSVQLIQQGTEILLSPITGAANSLP